ncbi:replication initiation negative regulator SeqA [Alteromonas sp. ASW11-19]|uniref:Negative modulator of initiation of replication n=1 Tax=Alteromonas salexigens TaxID=2982530 RepID=A0ABT2VKM5_9ALTE|nr:replication initiation negative regulator SeqA [Alteromonas salexigens]MCU7553850.1 replication initiation negative regulator SeqA [Alteromonas salexigens]
MKSIEIDDDLYAFIAGQTKHIGENASDILRRLLMPESPAPARGEETPPVSGDMPADPAVALTETAMPASAELIADAPEPAAVSQASGDILEQVTESALSTFSKRVDQFLFVLAQLHKQNPQAFGAVEQIRGKNRTYFATSKEALLNNGSSTNPKAIPDSPYWVVTNNNTAKKIAMLEQVLQKLGYDEKVVSTLVSRFAPEGK